MLAFYSMASNYEAASRFVTRRTDGGFGLVELAAAWDVWFALGRTDELNKAARRLPAAIKVATIHSCERL
jgi:hypothetical protein